MQGRGIFLSKPGKIDFHLYIHAFSIEIKKNSNQNICLFDELTVYSGKKSNFVRNVNDC
jgi:hypothetical protein